MTDIVKKEIPETFWAELSKELSTLVRHLSNQPKELWEQSLASGKDFLNLCRDLNLKKLETFFAQVLDYAYETVKSMLSAALEAIEHLAAAIAKSLTDHLWPWLKDAAYELARDLSKIGIRELITELVRSVIDYIKEHWHEWVSDWDQFAEHLSAVFA
jgi:hypothetical protein